MDVRVPGSALGALVLVGCSPSVPSYHPLGSGGQGTVGTASSSSSTSGATSTSSASSSTSSASSSSSSGSLACDPAQVSDLPGVSLAITGTTCVFTLAQAAAGIQIPWAITVASDVPGVTPTPQDWGGCGNPGPSGLIPFENLHGPAQTYCLCDLGPCAHNPVAETLHAGTWTGAFSWDGKNFNGPSDTGNQPGAPFPPGDYKLIVIAKGTVAADGGQAPFTVSASMTVHLLP